MTENAISIRSASVDTSAGRSVAVDLLRHSGSRPRLGRCDSTIRLAVFWQRRLDAAAVHDDLAGCDSIAQVRSTTDFSEVLTLASGRDIDAAILDVQTSRQEAARMVEALLEADETLVVLLLDGSVRLAMLEFVLSRGQTGYFTRDCTFAQLVEGLHALRQGHVALDPQVMKAKRGGRNSNRNVLRAVDRRGLADLTSRQKEVMCLFAMGCSTKEVSAKLGLAFSTVDNHRTALMRKLGVTKATQLTRIAMQEGYID